MSRLSTQAGAFLPRLLEQPGLLETSKTAEETNQAILELNVIIVYYLRPVKDYQSRFLETGWANTYF
jgi:hypothetical protein